MLIASSSFSTSSSNDKYSSSLTSVVNSWNKSWNFASSWGSSVTFSTCEKQHFLKQLQIVLSLTSSQEALSHLMGSKTVTCLMIVEAVFSPFRKDTTCLTKRFLYLALKLRKIPASWGCSLKVVFFSKNTSLMSSVGLKGSLGDLVHYQEKE